MGLLTGLIGGAILRTVNTSPSSLARRLTPPKRPAPPVRSPLDTIVSGRVGPLGGAITRQRSMAPQPGVRPPEGKGIGYDQNGQWYIKAGYMVDRNGNIRKRPCMNVANPRAAVRALRRVRGFEKIARRIIKVTPKFKSKPTYRGKRK
jgi:hypothetical protein